MPRGPWRSVPKFHGNLSNSYRDIQNNQCEPHGGASGKVRESKNCGIHPLGTMNVYTESNGNPSISC